MLRRFTTFPLAHIFTVACSVAALGLGGCKSAEKKTKKEESAAQKALKENPRLVDLGNDVAFQSFVGRLRIAVERRDRAVLSTLMVPMHSFGWRWDEAPQGETPFSYWDQNNLWPELLSLVHQRFTPTVTEDNKVFMVSPPDFANATESAYTGYRCGAQQVNGSWKLVYFIGGTDILPAQ